MSDKKERNKRAEQKTSKDHTILDIEPNVKEAIESWPRKFAKFIYNSEDGTICFRTPLSWLKLILTTSFYYCLLIGMVYGFYLLFVKVEYGTIDRIQGAPLAHAPPGSIWPTIMKFPDLNIRYEPRECRYCMSVSMNRVLFWEPEVYTGQNPANDTELSKHLQELEEAMKKTGSTLDYSEKMAFVTCDGKDNESKEMLDGLKFRLNTNKNMTSPGFYMRQFPYRRDEGESWKKIILDLSDTRFVSQLQNNKERIKMQCRAWASNIQQDERQSYKGRTRGGADTFVTLKIFENLAKKNPE